MKSALELLAPLQALAGESETDNDTSITRFFGVVGAPYCVYSILYADKKSGAPYILDGYNGSGNCRDLGEFLTAQGWRLTDNKDAQTGDIGFYCEYVSDENRWAYQHVFFVAEKLAGDEVITIEGNSKVFSTLEKARLSTARTGAFKGIGYKKRAIPTCGTWAVFHPPFAFETVVPKVYPAVRQLVLGSVGNDVCAWQLLLNAAHCDCGVTDGEFGTQTAAATKQWQKQKSLVVDGVVGVQSWTAMLEK